jgi:hypothetical protein
MKQKHQQKAVINPEKIIEVQVKQKTILAIAIPIVIFIFIGWLAFFRSSLLAELDRPDKGWQKIKNTFGELNLAMNDFKNDWREAQEKQRKLVENLNKNNNVNLNLTNEQIVFLREKVQTKIQEQQDNSEFTGWQSYRNDTFQLELKYPAGWRLETHLGRVVDNFLDIHLDNQLTADDLSCSDGYVGLEIITPSHKDKDLDLASWLKTQWLDNHALGGPSGTMELLPLGSNQVYKSQYSGSDTNCDGPGYFIEQNPTSYLYIYTNLAGDKQSEGLAWLEKIISTIKFISH